MKTIKIAPKNEAKTQSSENSLVKQELAGITYQIYALIEKQLHVVTKTEAKLTQWLQNQEPEQILDSVSTFGAIMTQTLSQIIAYFKNQMGLDSHSPCKTIRIRSPQRVRLKLVTETERENFDCLDSFGEKETHRKQIIIQQLKQANKNCERKLVQVTREFQLIKKQYEAEIEKYRTIVSSSLLSLQANLGSKPFSQLHPGNSHSPSRLEYPEPRFGKPAQPKRVDGGLTYRPSMDALATFSPRANFLRRSETERQPYYYG